MPRKIPAHPNTLKASRPFATPLNRAGMNPPRLRPLPTYSGQQHHEEKHAHRNLRHGGGVRGLRSKKEPFHKRVATDYATKRRCWEERGTIGAAREQNERHAKPPGRKARQQVRRAVDGNALFEPTVAAVVLLRCRQRG